jgi:hypothetical protein
MALSDRVALLRANGLWDAFLLRARTDELGRVKNVVPDFSVKVMKERRSDASVEQVSTRQLKRYLEDPVGKSIERHLGLYADDETIEDLVVREDEPFFSEFPLDYQLKTRSIEAWLDGTVFSAISDNMKPVAVDIFSRFYDAALRESKTPQGTFAELDKTELGETVSAVAANLEPLVAEMKAARVLLRTIRVGSPAGEGVYSGAGIPVKQFESLHLRCNTKDHETQSVSRNVALSGDLPWVWQDHGGSWHALVLTGSRRSGGQPGRHLIGPALDYLVSIAGEDGRQWAGKEGISFYLVHSEIVKKWVFKPPVKDAEPYLNNLVAAYLNQTDLPWLPFETVAATATDLLSLEDGEINDTLRRDFAVLLDEAFGEVENYTTRIARPQIPKDALDQARHRFGIFFKYFRQEKRW